MKILFVFLVLLLAAPFTHAEWQEVKEKKGLNLNQYCSQTFGSRFVANLNGSTVYDWGCMIPGTQERRNMELAEACQQQYGTKEVSYKNHNDPYSWYCSVVKKKWVPVQVGLDLNRYCKDNFGSRFVANLNGSTVYDWGCMIPGTQERRNMQLKSACMQQHGTQKVGFTNQNDPYSWYCEK